MTDGWTLAFADDLTGALEVGAAFQATVVTDPAHVPAPAPAVVLDTESRHLSPEAAAARVAAGARAFGARAPSLIFKKTDSTLRGNIAAELRALCEGWPHRRVIYAPAYPQLGRTVIAGHLLVDGVPVHLTAFGQDALNPVRSSRVADVLGTLPVEIVDGETVADLRTVAQRILASRQPVIAAGPAGLARELGELAGATPPRTWPRLARCLVVNGSRHPVSAAQVALAQSQGCLGDGWELFEYLSPLAGPARAHALGLAVRERIQGCDGLIVFGGDTAYGIQQALGGLAMNALGEVLPGVPVSSTQELHWVTKAGGFGSPSLLCDLRQKLT